MAHKSPVLPAKPSGLTKCVLISCLGLNHLLHEAQTTSRVWENSSYHCYLPIPSACNKLNSELYLWQRLTLNAKGNSISPTVMIRTGEKRKKEAEQSDSLQDNLSHCPPRPQGDRSCGVIQGLLTKPLQRVLECSAEALTWAFQDKAT